MNFFFPEDSLILRDIVTQFISLRLYNFTNRSIDIEKQNNVLCILDLNSHESKLYLNRLSELNLFNGKFTWLIYSKNMNESLKLIQKQNINLDSKILLVIQETNKKHFIYNVKNPSLKRNNQFFIKTVGNYTETRGLVFENPFQNIDFMMHETVLNIGISVSITFVYF